MRARHLAIVLLTFSPVLEIGTSYSQPAKAPIYKSPSYPIEQRIDDLISRMGILALKGIKSKVSPTTTVTYVQGCNVTGNKLNEIEKAKKAAEDADTAIVVIGEDGYGTNGEGRDLTGMQEELLQVVDVRNTGKRKGDEVVELYINDLLSSTSRPIKEIKGFSKVALEPGEQKTVTLKLLAEDLSLLDRDMNVVVEPGTFEVMVGSSSQDIKLKGLFVVK